MVHDTTPVRALAKPVHAKPEARMCVVRNAGIVIFNKNAYSSGRKAKHC
jgi:hypothetical protein